MVVVSGSWGKNAATYPIPISNDMVITDSNKMNAKAILVCRPNSHPFQDRTLCLDQPVKVGRSVARTKATPTNATFDCKVLSRNHAVLWYENGKFFLQDTKSSNGTYVNNNRLPSNELESHEVSSGDIVQFGVDVVENNRKVTHGCIIAMLKLYLPDGKEAKASPSITEGHKHGYVPLDELYKLNQVLQEASQRELYLETKLNALQQVVNEARKSADECWQTYVGEERLLSRVAVLERQLMQAGKGWSDEKMKEELDKLQEERAVYETAAKEKLMKLHDERLDALAVAAEQEKARTTAEQECILVKEQLLQAQDEIQAIAQKLAEEQQTMNEEKMHYEQRERELRGRLDLECEKLNDLQVKLDQLKCVSINSNCNICDDDDMNRKKELLDEELEENCNKTNGMEDNHISLTVAPVEAVVVKEMLNIETEDNLDNKEENSCSCREDENLLEQEKYNLENEDFSGDPITVDSRTLKYQFQTAQNELKKQMEKLDAINESNQEKLKDMENALCIDRQVLLKQEQENEFLRDEISSLKQNLKESNNESQQLRDKLSSYENVNKDVHKECKCAMSAGNNATLNGVNLDQFTALEEELVFLKEMYANLNEEKLLLSKELKSVREQYNTLCNKSYNKMFVYIVPLVLMVLYLLISNMFS